MISKQMIITKEYLLKVLSNFAAIKSAILCHFIHAL